MISEALHRHRRITPVVLMAASLLTAATPASATSIIYVPNEFGLILHIIDSDASGPIQPVFDFLISNFEDVTIVGPVVTGYIGEPFSGETINLAAPLSDTPPSTLLGLMGNLGTLALFEFDFSTLQLFGDLPRIPEKARLSGIGTVVFGPVGSLSPFIGPVVADFSGAWPMDAPLPSGETQGIFVLDSITAVTAVPEPAVLTFVGSGFAVLLAALVAYRPEPTRRG